MAGWSAIYRIAECPGCGGWNAWHFHEGIGGMWHEHDGQKMTFVPRDLVLYEEANSEVDALRARVAELKAE